MTLFLNIYDFLTKHKKTYRLFLAGGFLAVITLSLNLHFKENIMDFLPLSDREKKDMKIYEKITGAEQIIIIFETRTPDTDSPEDKIEAIDYFESRLARKDSSLLPLFTSRIDVNRYLQTLHRIYAHFPYFALESDYKRFDSILSTPHAVKNALRQNKNRLQLPNTFFLRQVIKDDPLNLFTPFIGSLQDFMPLSQAFSTTDGYMITADEHMAFAFLQTRNGTNETKENTKLVNLLNDICAETNALFPALNVRLLGAPVIAVENASRIKKDSLNALLLALLLFAGILFRFFRHDLRTIPLTLLTICFGWLFGLSVIKITLGEISLIVLGMGSVITGIALNYPLHILFHNRYTANVKQTLKEVITPLIVGNITTIGAFLTLIPLKASALRDLGLFATATLAGTILFSLIFLPHMIKQQKQYIPPPNITEKRTTHPLTKLKLPALILLTLVTGLLFLPGRHIQFDPDITHINYMTQQQRNDFNCLNSLNNQNETNIYIVQNSQQITPPDQIPLNPDIQKITSVYRWLPSTWEQQQRLRLWNNFWHNRKDTLILQLQKEASLLGFNPRTFEPFIQMLSADFQPQPLAFFEPLTRNIIKNHYTLDDNNNPLLITKINVNPTNLEKVKKTLTSELEGKNESIFDIHSLNNQITSRMSRDFDYIGLLCSFIVFALLCLAFRSLKLALLAFLPMLISWIWILGIMNLLNLQFNIVNIILAGFIFGQGDDYTIFVVEGLIYERRERKPMLPQYRQSIILSALLMFVGMGVLVVAKHPALFSLGFVTLIGMIIVVIMAGIIPPLFFNLLIPDNKKTI